MERYVLVPDSFKGTLGSGEICAILREEILRAKPDAEVVSIPVADGGGCRFPATALIWRR